MAYLSETDSGRHWVSRQFNVGRDLPGGPQEHNIDLVNCSSIRPAADLMVVSRRYSDQAPTITKEANAPFGTFRPTALQAAVISTARKTFFLRGDLRRIVWSILGKLRPGPLDVMIGNAAFRLGGEPNVTDVRLLLISRYDQVELDFLSEVLGAGGVFVDVGANIGAYSLLLWSRIRAIGTIVAIEPNPTAVARLEFNRAASGAQEIIIVPNAAGDVETEVEFAQKDGNLGGGRVVQGVGTLSVPMRPLGMILSERGLARCDAIKVDVEGFEDRALLPYFRNVDRAQWPKRIVLEDLHAAEWREDCVSELVSIGYRRVGRTRNNLLLALL